MFSVMIDHALLLVRFLAFWAHRCRIPEHSVRLARGQRFPAGEVRALCGSGSDFTCSFGRLPCLISGKSLKQNVSIVYVVQASDRETKNASRCQRGKLLKPSLLTFLKEMLRGETQTDWQYNVKSTVPSSSFLYNELRISPIPLSQSPCNVTHRISLATDSHARQERRVSDRPGEQSLLSLYSNVTALPGSSTSTSSIRLESMNEIWGRASALLLAFGQ